MPRTPRHRRRALTLVESLMAAMVLLVVVVAVSQALLAGQMQVYDAAHRARAIELAEALMDEVLRLPYADADTDNETTRATFDDLDDFDGYSESGTLRDAAGTAYPSEYQVFTRTVAVSTTSTATRSRERCATRREPPILPSTRSSRARSPSPRRRNRCRVSGLRSTGSR